MMKAHLNAFTVIVFSGLLLFTMQGCTLIGGIVGSQIGAREQMESEASPFPGGTEVEVSLDYGQRIKGVYIGSDLLDGEVYTPAYESGARELVPDHQLPGLNEKLTVRIYPDSSVQTILFRGFGGYRKYTLLGTEIGNGRTWIMPLENVLQTVDSEHNEFSRGNYSVLAARHKLPLRTRIVINTAQGIEYFRTDRISSITRKKGNKAVTGMLVGLALDAVAFAVFAISWEKDRSSSYGPIFRF